ncbi:hypothetical protein H8E88_14860 [candidate division KSB1 bacterium]|nr:hypothetical protein [candidate division KSB1 bacterium]MBL7094005.1 hypothetical protein [candidate division KSB1 bacterium]
MNNTSFQLPARPKKRFLSDREWAHKHFAEISKQFPNQWVAVYNKKIISANINGSEVEKTTSKKLGHQDFFIFFAEKGIHVY